jgi:hypothetical protein
MVGRRTIPATGSLISRPAHATPSATTPAASQCWPRSAAPSEGSKPRASHRFLFSDKSIEGPSHSSFLLSISVLRTGATSMGDPFVFLRKPDATRTSDASAKLMTLPWEQRVLESSRGFPLPPACDAKTTFLSPSGLLKINQSFGRYDRHHRFLLRG